MFTILFMMNVFSSKSVLHYTFFRIVSLWLQLDGIGCTSAVPRFLHVKGRGMPTCFSHLISFKLCFYYNGR